VKWELPSFVYLVRVERNGQRGVCIRREGRASGIGLDVEAMHEWEELVAALPLDKQILTVLARLQRLNSHSDGRATLTISNGAVTGSALCVDEMFDISLVRALRDLQSLTCWLRESRRPPSRFVAPAAHEITIF
jgi:hypothetical protein